MSILIENMEMPKSCFQCWNYDKINAHTGGWYCVLTLSSYGCNPFKRPAWCPLKEIPPHGRLIDADKLRHSHCAECTLYPDKCLGDECDWDAIYHIDHAKTVIEADEEVEELEELKECPFCGGKAVLDDCGDRHSYFVRCKKCGVNQDHLYFSKAAAIKAWNRRVLIVPEKWGDNI